MHISKNDTCTNKETGRDRTRGREGRKLVRESKGGVEWVDVIYSQAGHTCRTARIQKPQQQVLQLLSVYLFM